MQTQPQEKSVQVGNLNLNKWAISSHYTATLEADWNQHLRRFKKPFRSVKNMRSTTSRYLPDTELDERILELGNDFGLIWNADATTNEDRKRLLSLLIEDITLLRDGYQVEV